MNNQDEIDLINFFMRHKRLNRAQQARFANLVARDYCRINTEVKDNIEMSERKIKATDIALRIHNPKGVIDFLRLFSTDDILKWFTHKWDNQSDTLTLDNLWKRLKEKSNKLREYSFGQNNKGIPASLYYHVLNFISNNPTERSIYDQFGNKFETTWKDLKEWCEDNPGIWPASFITTNGVTFESVINRFKRTIEFRTDCEVTEKFGMQIWKLIRDSINGAVKVDFTPKFRKQGRDINIYSNVNNLYAGLRGICDWISSYKSQGDILVVDLENHDSYYLLTMLHKGSYFSGTDEKLKGLSGDFKKIRELLFSVCDFSMYGEENGKAIEVIALDDETQMDGKNIISETKIIECNSPVEGVLYSLKLYR